MAVNDVPMSGTRSVADGGNVLKRFPPHRALVVVAVVNGLVGAAASAGLLYAGIMDGAPFLMLLAAFVGATAPPTGYALARQGALRPVLTATVLRTPKPLWGWTTVPLTDITGVGQWYFPDGRFAGWRLFVWGKDGVPIRVPLKPPTHSAPRGQRGLLRQSNRNPAVNWDYVADSPAGQAALVIDGQVLAVQGDRGPLATTRRESIPLLDNRATAYWSPDGTGGSLVAARGLV
ncbi:MAG: hypothetical protein QOI35_1180 [Cryptosporangiaceae bacterium]|nr:hypothetical protein [Cryptosporangiaceae bacterium]